MATPTCMGLPPGVRFRWGDPRAGSPQMESPATARAGGQAWQFGCGAHALFALWLRPSNLDDTSLWRAYGATHHRAGQTHRRCEGLARDVQAAASRFANSLLAGGGRVEGDRVSGVH